MIADFPKRARSYSADHRAFTIEEMRFLGSQTTLVGLQFIDCPIGDAHIHEIRNLPRLVNLGLDGCKLTDKALASLAVLPKLEILSLDRTKITGSGLVHFHSNRKLETLCLCETLVDDENIVLARDIPKLSILQIAKTKVTFDGMLALAANPRLKVVADKQFSPAQYAQFEAVQRRLAGQAKSGSVAQPGSADVVAAKTVLEGFMKAINAWERRMANDSFSQSTKAKSECSAIFDQFCTPKDRAYGRPNALSYSLGPAHPEPVTDVEQPAKNKILIYTKDYRGFQYRYVVVRCGLQWKVDHKERFSGGWKRDFL